MPQSQLYKFFHSKAGILTARAWLLVLFFGVWGVQAAYAGLTITPTSWNVVGLDSNNPSIGPNSFQIGARVCNTGGAAVTNVSASFVWDSINSFINLTGSSTLTMPSLAAGSCTDFYFPVVVTKTASAFNTTRRYHITASGDSVGSVSTPTPRELFVEKIISQGRNAVNSISGPTTVYVGQTYNYTVNASTATQGYEQLEAFLDLSNVVFQVQSIATTYSAPSGGTNDKFYADACGWDNDPLSANYRSCIGPPNYSGGKAGGTVITTYTVKVLSTGNTTASTLILDFSGSSYHYNSDYGIQVISITSLPPPLTLSKSANPTTLAAPGSVSYTLRLTNTGSFPMTVSDFVDTLPVSPGSATYTTNSSTFNGAAIGNPTISGATLTWNGSFVVPAGQTRDLVFSASLPAVQGTYTNQAIAHMSGFQIDTTQITTDNVPATATVTMQFPDLTIAKAHTGNFTQGQTGATYSITATNSGLAATSGTVTVTDTLPAGLTATAISGTGWSCVLGTLTCTRSDALAAAASYPAITVTVTVANNAAASVTNSVGVSGGGQTNTSNDSATDATTINQLSDMTIAKSHVGNFSQGQAGATYSITATNSGFAATTGTVTVTDTLPAGLTATAISGTGWSCVLGTLTCTRSDALAVNSSYPIITVTVNVSLTAAASVTNSAGISGGGQTNTANDSANDLTTINPAAPPSISLVKSVSPNGAQIPGTDLLYTVVYTNTGGQLANNFIIVDPNTANVVPAERVFLNVDFKLGSLISSPGSTGLTASFEYSNNGGSTWTYTPVSGGGGAPPGYDRSVTNVRWSFTGNLSHLGPNNTGSVSLTARIR
ncbi:MAG: hypothetical protein ABI923_00250 [bacterium]